MSLGDGISLLLVEDDGYALDACCRIIRRCFPQMVLHAARTPRQALVLSKNYKHDIVVTDLFSTTGEPGIEIAADVCSEKPDVKVIFITTNTDHNLQTFRSHSRPLCVESVINKPIDATELISKIKNAIFAIHPFRRPTLP